MIVQLIEDSNGDLILPIPDEIIKELGAKVGDTLVFEETEICDDLGEYQGFTLTLQSNIDKYREKYLDELENEQDTETTGS